jgi:hypothetical protein
MKRRTFLWVESIERRCVLSALAYSLTTNMATYQVGQPVELNFTETNVSQKPVRFAIGPFNSGFDIVHNGVTVWTSNAGIQPQYLLLKVLRPGQSETLKATWNGAPNLSSAGSLTGTFTATNQQAPTEASATFMVFSPAPKASVTTTLKTGEFKFRPGQPVALTMTLKNTGDTSVTIPEGPGSGFFSVSRRGRPPLWSSSESGGPADSAVLEPGHTVTLTTIWNGRSNQGHARTLRPGIYTLFAEDGGFEASTTIRIV